MRGLVLMWAALAILNGAIFLGHCYTGNWQTGLGWFNAAVASVAAGVNASALYTAGVWR